MNPVESEPCAGVQLLDAASYAELRRRAIFECCKWDPQVEDVETLAPSVVVLKSSVWQYLKSAAEGLAAETLALEWELVGRTKLHRDLALPRPIRKLLAKRLCQRACPAVRIMRFDFHPTEDGWKVSEVNADVPGGFNEASGWTRLVGENVEAAIPSGDPAGGLVDAIACRVRPGGVVALVHATAYTDDRQVMVFLARRLQRHGLRAVLVGPDHIDWQDGRAFVQSEWFRGPIDFVYRFFPAEWLPNLGRKIGWQYYFGGTETPLCNPATALLTQSKRWPLVMDQLKVPLPAWKSLLPETRDPREVDWKRDAGWVLKPAFGRIGESIGLEGVTPDREWKAIRRSVRWTPRYWIAQRRFNSKPILIEQQPWHVCFGVYTVDGRAVGIYGRTTRQPLINHLAKDIAVLVELTPPTSTFNISSKTYDCLATV